MFSETRMKLFNGKAKNVFRRRGQKANSKNRQPLEEKHGKCLHSGWWVDEFRITSEDHKFARKKKKFANCQFEIEEQTMEVCGQKVNRPPKTTAL